MPALTDEALARPGDQGHRDCAGGALGLTAGPGRPARAQRARAHGRRPAYARLARSCAERALPLKLEMDEAELVDGLVERKSA